MARTAIVVTTINDGGFCENLKPVLENGQSNAALIVIGDHKTPPNCGVAVSRLASDGYDATWFDVAAQRRWLAALPGLTRHIPWNSDNRRNLGVLEAWRRGFDTVISIDDDNIPLEPTRFLDRNLTPSQPVEREIISAERWMNVCELLECRSRRDGSALHVFPRGHPHSRRGARAIDFAPLAKPEAAVLHLGLWLNEPDVDAATRSSVAPEAISALIDQSVLMPSGALAGISSQNLAAARRLIPAWWYARMGRISGEVRIDRFGDMLQGYFAAMAIAAMGERIAVGPPLVQHIRNPHSVLDDLVLELPGMALLEELLPLLEAPRSPAASYAEAYLAIADDLTNWARTARPRLWGNTLPRWSDRMAATMAAWVDACRLLDPVDQALGVVDKLAGSQSD